jgi:hypothetical protein
MTVKRISVTTCDACGSQETSVSDEHGSSGVSSYRWGLLEWDEPPADGEKTRQYKELTVCPPHLDMLLKMIADERARLAESES